MAQVESLLARGRVTRPEVKPRVLPPDPQQRALADMRAEFAAIRSDIRQALKAVGDRDATITALQARVDEAIAESQRLRAEMAANQQALLEAIAAVALAQPEEEPEPIAPDPVVEPATPVIEPEAVVLALVPRLRREDIEVTPVRDRNDLITRFVLKAAGREEVAIEVRRNQDGSIVDLVVRVPGEKARVVPVARDDEGHLRLVVNH